MHVQADPIAPTEEHEKEGVHSGKGSARCVSVTDSLLYRLKTLGDRRLPLLFDTFKGALRRSEALRPPEASETLTMHRA